MGVVNVLPQFHRVIPLAATAFGTGFMTGMLLLGCFVGCWFYPYIADGFSRKRALLVSSIIFIIAALVGIYGGRWQEGHTDAGWACVAMGFPIHHRIRFLLLPAWMGPASGEFSHRRSIARCRVLRGY